MSKKIFIISGEHSGDFYGASLAKDLMALEPDLQISGIGCHRMKQAGVELIYDCSNWSAIGFFESIVKIPYLLMIGQKLKKYILKTKPDLIVLIDFPAFNMRLAEFTKKAGFKSVYYFPPSAWSNKINRPLFISSITDKVITTFEHTWNMYRKAGKDASFLGHPMVGLLKPLLSKEEVYKRLNINPGNFIISILPGSRLHEIKYIFPDLIESAKIIKKRFKEADFVVSAVSEPMEKVIKYYLKLHNFDAKILTGYSHELMNISSFLIITSGTATLEATCLGVPMVIVYKVSPLSWFIAKRTIEFPAYAGLASLVLGRQIIPEVIQDNLTPQKLSDTVLDIILNKEKMKKMKEELLEAKNKLGPIDAAQKIAKEIYSMLS